jgi:hypothetical protein
MNIVDFHAAVRALEGAPPDPRERTLPSGKKVIMLPMAAWVKEFLRQVDIDTAEPPYAFDYEGQAYTVDPKTVQLLRNIMKGQPHA